MNEKELAPEARWFVDKLESICHAIAAHEKSINLLFRKVNELEEKWEALKQ